VTHGKTLTELIEAKRDGQELTRAEIECVVDAFTAGEMPDYQMAAWLMAAFLRGLSFDETVSLTRAMAESGRMVDLSAITGTTVDKHSTGGVADTTTLIVAPLAAACGLRFAKMSGRGLAHTGGTLDKLESIPNLSVDLTPDQFIRQVAEIGVAVAAQSPDVDPADKAMYALRDVTGTVPSIPLIVGSVVSKKVAGGARVIVIDVKAGSGAFMKTTEDAVKLGRAIVETGAELERTISCVVTDMDAPLGLAVGNALEVTEAVEVLRGHATGPLLDLSVELVARLLVGAGQDPDLGAARSRALEALEKGSAISKFADWVAAQGGDPGVALHPESVLPAAAVTRVVNAPAGGFLVHLDAEGVGRAALALGAGRAKKEDTIDPAAGLVMVRRVGDSVAAGEPLATLHAASEELLDSGEERLLEAATIGDTAPGPRPLILAEIG
jgi:pyrimidine-nucleoside phosphorylase